MNSCCSRGRTAMARALVWKHCLGRILCLSGHSGASIWVPFCSTTYQASSGRSRSVFHFAADECGVVVQCLSNRVWTKAVGQNRNEHMHIQRVKSCERQGNSTITRNSQRNSRDQDTLVGCSLTLPYVVCRMTVGGGWPPVFRLCGLN